MDYIIAEYIWLDAFDNYRSKSRVFDAPDFNPDNLPIWTYDGSSTGQATGSDSEIYLKPVAVFNDPFRGKPHVLVWCTTYDSLDNPLPNNYRDIAVDIFNENLDEKPWFGLEQEYFLYKVDDRGVPFTPVGWPSAGFPEPQGKYYCAVGGGKSYGRKIADAALINQLNAGVKISGINAEVAIGQWEYQVGPCEGIEAGDHLHISRYILIRTAEESNIAVLFDPKPLSGDWNGTGCHANFSTKSMREGNGKLTGLQVIYESVEKLGKKHKEHMEVYGIDNDKRLSGIHETSDYNTFTSATAHRGCSIRIPRLVAKNGSGYFEDRRPAGNADPYLVTSKLFETCTLRD